jgi:hypothetical protein
MSDVTVSLHMMLILNYRDIWKIMKIFRYQFSTHGCKGLLGSVCGRRLVPVGVQDEWAPRVCRPGYSSGGCTLWLDQNISSG